MHEKQQVTEGMRMIELSEYIWTPDEQNHPNFKRFLTPEEYGHPLCLKLHQSADLMGTVSDQIVIYAPTAQNIIDTNALQGSEEENTFALMAFCTNVPPDDLKKLLAVDTARIGDVIANFSQRLP